MNDHASPDSPRGSTTSTDSAEAKQQLEIEKLRLEMSFIRRNHYVQIFNTTCLVLIGLLVFYFFQRPQVEVAEATRISIERQADMNRQSTEKYQALSMYLAARANKDERDQAEAVQLISSAYRDQEWLAAIAKSQSAIEEAKRAQVAAWRELRTEIQRLNQEARESIERLQRQLEHIVITHELQSPETRREIGEALASLRIATQDARLQIERRLKESRCTEFRNNADELRSRLQELESQLQFESPPTGRDGKKGLGPVYKALQDQLWKTRTALDETLAQIKLCETEVSK